LFSLQKRNWDRYSRIAPKQLNIGVITEDARHITEGGGAIGKETIQANHNNFILEMDPIAATNIHLFLAKLCESLFHFFVPKTCCHNNIHPEPIKCFWDKNNRKNKTMPIEKNSS
jgi:hypothetical protein